MEKSYSMVKRHIIVFLSFFITENLLKTKENGVK